MDNDEDMVDRTAKYIFYIIYNETSLSGLIIAFVGGWGIFYRITKSDSDEVDNWTQNRLSQVEVGILSGLLFPSLPFLFQRKAEVRQISKQVTRRIFTQTCGTWLYSRRASLLKAF